MNIRLVVPALLLTAACGGELEVNPAPDGAPGVESNPGVEVEVTPADHQLGRSWRRMDVDQLQASIRRVTGGIEWTPEGAEDIKLFRELQGTLGKPNYITSTIEDLSPFVLFQKFLDDAAVSVCSKLIEKELAASPSDRVLLVHVDENDTMESAPEKVQENMSAALLRFHGRKVSPTDSKLEPWTWLFRSATHVSDGTPADGWQTVCVGLLTHPHFYSY